MSKYVNKCITEPKITRVCIIVSGCLCTLVVGIICRLNSNVDFDLEHYMGHHCSRKDCKIMAVRDVFSFISFGMNLEVQ